MVMPTFTMRELVESGVHFGHTTRLWNPKMKPFIFGERNGIHIVNLDHTVPQLHRSLEFLQQTAANGGRILFVGTKNQARETIKNTALECGQYYVNHRWLGGMLTNWQTILNSISKMKKLQKQLDDPNTGLTKKERLNLLRKKERLDLVLGGIGEMGSQPDVLFIVDINKEDTAIAEAKVLNIPVVAIVDTNCNPEGIDYPIYGNDDSLRAIKLYCRLVKESILEGMKNQMQNIGVDLGASANPDTAKDVKSVKAKTEVKETAKPAKAEVKAKAAEKSDAKADEKPAEAKAAEKADAKADEKPAKADAKADAVVAEKPKKPAKKAAAKKPDAKE